VFGDVKLLFVIIANKSVPHVEFPLTISTFCHIPFSLTPFIASPSTLLYRVCYTLVDSMYAVDVLTL